MKTIDDQLTQAGAGLRDASSRLPDRSWEARSRSHHGRAVAALTGVAVVIAAIGIPAIWLGTGDGVPLTGTTQPLEPPDTAPPTIETGNTAPISTPPADFPYLAILHPLWYPTEASGAGIPDIETLYIVYEDGSGGIATLEMNVLGKGSTIDDLLASRTYEEEPITVRQQPAALFVFEPDLFGIRWMETPEVEASIVAEGVNREGVLALAVALESIPHEAWIELTIASTQWPDTTTTVVVGG